MKKIAALVLFAVCLVFGITSYADEGMWLLNNLPLKQLKDKYNFEPTPGWVEHVQKSSARLPNCSSSFVSSDGLVVTNGHCAKEAVLALSTPQNNLYEKGFYAKTYAQELKTGRPLRVLMRMEDVTDAVNNLAAASTAGSRQQAIQDIQNAYSGKYNLTCEIAALYQGGQYYNYCYKVYDDVRLVFSTEKNVWFMGGDADNFEYPRFTMDIAFLRVYEDGKPANPPNYLKWSKAGAKEGELIFVSGHPGRTARLLTSSALKTERDVRVPFLLDLFRRRELTIQQFMLRGKNQKRLAESDLFSWQNARKLYVGKIRGLQDPHLVTQKKKFEDELISNPNYDQSIRDEYKEGLRMVEEAQQTIKEVYPGMILLSRGLGFDSRLYDYAAGFPRDSAAAANTLKILETEPPIDLAYEEAKLRDSLTHLVEVMGADDWTVRTMTVIFGNGPADIARKLVYGTALSDVKKLAKSNEQNALQSSDPMIRFAAYMRYQSASYAQKYDESLEKERKGYAKISNVLFEIYGTDSYPDATFTLRLSFGTVSGYEENGKPVLPWTTIGGAYRHSAEFDNAGNWKLPARWRNRKNLVNRNTPLNFVSDLDITGGNSGSPVFNRNLEIVGIVFDSNIHGLVSDYDFNYSPLARAVSVHSAGIVEVLKKIYRADRLVRELTR